MKKKNITAVRYKDDFKKLWNSFINGSKNSTFLFFREFMDYHKDRFVDHSLILFDGKNNVVSVFPATEHGDKVVSHGGLTYGGLLFSNDNKAVEIIQILKAVLDYYAKNSFEELIYKAIPYIYHQIPADEDLYALFRVGAELYRRDISQVIYVGDKIKFSKGRKWMLSRARKSNLEVKESKDFRNFIQIEIDTLKKYGVKPVHSAEEIELLANRFPDNIKLYSVFDDQKMIAGVLTFETSTLIHTQYIASTEDGKENGATEFIIQYILENKMKGKKYFDFGISTEKQGTYLNEGLAAFKESFGARGVTYDFYKINL